MAEEDLIFGKNRHFFGGIEPSNMIEFSVVPDSLVNKIRIKAVLPEDTVINGQTLCSVAGAVIRRKATGYPLDEFDGELIATIVSSAVLLDPVVNKNDTYYYAAFPFTTQGVYNRNHENRAAINEPTDMLVFVAKSIYNATTQLATVKIIADLSVGVAGAVIRRSTKYYPLNENDGELFKTITSDGTYTDSNVQIGNVYYYSAFPYKSVGSYNRNPINRSSINVRNNEYLYGYDLNTDDNNPSTRIIYPNDVDNTNFAAAMMNFTTGTFSYGSWTSTPGEDFMPKPCMLTYSGVVDHYLNPNDYTKKTNGTASSVANSAFSGNAMMEWPKIFVKRWTEGNIYKFRCSDIQLDDDYECWCNYDRNNNKINHFYTPIYFGSNISSKMRSISGQSNLVSSNASTEITYAKANGNDWYTEILADRLLIQDLLVMMGKSTDCQRVFGNGVCGTSSAIGQGTMNARGLFWGEDDKTSGVKVFGMENWWGNLFRRTAGWMNIDGIQKVKITRGTYDGSAAVDYNIDGSGYLTIANATPSGTSGGYISSMKTEAFGRIPIIASGSATTYEADGMYYNNSGATYALVGGNYGNGLIGGPFCVRLDYAASNASTAFGAALSCKPLA